MSKERKITDSDLENVSGAGTDLDDADVTGTDSQPGGTGVQPPTGGGSDGAFSSLLPTNTSCVFVPTFLVSTVIVSKKCRVLTSSPSSRKPSASNTARRCTRCAMRRISAGPVSVRIALRSTMRASWAAVSFMGTVLSKVHRGLKQLKRIMLHHEDK